MRHRVIIHNDPFDPYNTKSIFHPIDYNKCACDFDNQSFTVCWPFILTSLLRYRGIFKIDPNKKYRQFLISVILYHWKTKMKIENISTLLTLKSIFQKVLKLWQIHLRCRVIFNIDPFDPNNLISIFHKMDYKKCANDFYIQYFLVCCWFILISLLRYRGIFKNDPHNKYGHFLIMVILYHDQTKLKIINISTLFTQKNIWEQFPHL